MIFNRSLTPAESRAVRLAGVAGMALSAFLMGRAAAGGATAVLGPDALAAYRGYFRAVLWILLPLFALVWRILPLRAADRPRAAA